MLKKAAQRGRRRFETGGVPSGAHGATNKEHQVCARRRVGEAAGSPLRISMSREQSWRTFSASVRSSIASGTKSGQFMESGVDKLERSVDNPEIQMEGRDVRDETQSNQWPWPALFMSASAAIADSPRRQAWARWPGVQAGGLAVRSVNILFQVCLPPSRLRAPVSRGDCAISRRTVMNNAGL